MVEPLIETDSSLEVQIRNIESASRLWYEWAIERGHDDPDLEYYIGQLMDKVRAGTYQVLVGMDPDSGDEMGMIDMQLDYEPGDRNVFAFIDKLYVRPKYRGGIVAKRLCNAADLVSKQRGATRGIIAVMPDGPTGYYEKVRGFEPYMQLMKYEVDQ